MADASSVETGRPWWVRRCELMSMAERLGFEPRDPFRGHTLSRRAPSTTQPSLRKPTKRFSRQASFTTRGGTPPHTS